MLERIALSSYTLEVAAQSARAGTRAETQRLEDEQMLLDSAPNMVGVKGGALMRCDYRASRDEDHWCGLRTSGGGHEEVHANDSLLQPLCRRNGINEADCNACHRRRCCRTSQDVGARPVSGRGNAESPYRPQLQRIGDRNSDQERRQVRHAKVNAA